MTVPSQTINPHEVSPMPSAASSSSKKNKKKGKNHIVMQQSPVPQQPHSGSRRRARRANSCSMSTLTRSTTSSLTLGSEWGSTFDMSSMKSSLSSLNSSLYSPLPRSGHDRMTPLKDKLPSPYHQPRRESSSSLYSEPDSSHTRESSTSLGESSLSSFLSVLLEDEESTPREISIVPDNPKPEEQSIRELRLSFIRSAYKNDKPKCRWDYLTRDNIDREQLARSRRRSKLENRSASFSQLDGISKQLAKQQRLKKPTRTCSTSTIESATERVKKKVKEGMFLRMPVRKTSPNSEASKKKSIMSRVNMSDTDLILLPTQPGLSECSPPKMARRRSSLKSNSSHSRKSHKSSESLKSYASRSKSSESLKASAGRIRSNQSLHSDIDEDEDDNIFRGNARWTKADTQPKQPNKFLGGLVLPPSPIPSPAIPSQQNASLGKAQRRLTDHLSDHMRSTSLLGETSSDEEDLKDDSDIATLPTKKTSLKRTSSKKKISRKSSGSQRSTRSGSSLKRTKSGSSLRSTNHSVASTKSGSSLKSGASSKSGSSRKSRSKSPGALKNRSKSPGALKSRSKSPGPLSKYKKTPEKSDKRPPKLPTRLANSPPFVLSTSSRSSSSSPSPTKSPKPLKKKKVSLPLSPKKNNKVAIAPPDDLPPIELIPKPKMAPTKTSTSPRLSSHSRKTSPKLSSHSRKTLSSHSRKKQFSPESDRSPVKPRRGRWFSPFDGKQIPFESSTHSRTTVPCESSLHSRSTTVPCESSNHSRSTIPYESSSHSRYSTTL